MLAEKETTGGQYKRIGEIYGFPVKIVSETSFENGLPFVDNRFFVEGNYKYQYNYGHIAKSDPIAAANNFLNALQKIPSYIEQYDSRCKALEKETATVNYGPFSGCRFRGFKIRHHLDTPVLRDNCVK